MLYPVVSRPKIEHMDFRYYISFAMSLSGTLAVTDVSVTPTSFLLKTTAMSKTYTNETAYITLIYVKYSELLYVRLNDGYIYI
jgi:hypothetical protein